MYTEQLLTLPLSDELFVGQFLRTLAATRVSLGAAVVRGPIRLVHRRPAPESCEEVRAGQDQLPVRLHLTPLVAEFARRYPGISFEFDLTPRRVDLVSEPFDVAIRMGELADSGLIARQLARLPRYLYASPQYLELAGEPKEPGDLAQHECLYMPRAATWTLDDGTKKVEVAVGGRFTLNSVGMICRLATLDLGIALLAEEIVADDLAGGR